MRPWSRPFARVAVALAWVMLVAAVINLTVNTARVSSWLPLILMAPWFLYLGMRSLRCHNKR